MGLGGTKMFAVVSHTCKPCKTTSFKDKFWNFAVNINTVSEHYFHIGTQHGGDGGYCRVQGGVSRMYRGAVTVYHVCIVDLL